MDDGPCAWAIFFRNLVKGSPFLIDWLLTSSKDDKEVFRKMVSSFMACQNVVGHKGVYGRLVRSEDRAPLVYWLKEATSSQHLTLWEVMDAILIASAKESSFIPRMIRPPTVADDWGVDIDLEEVLEGIKVGEKGGFVVHSTRFVFKTRFDPRMAPTAWKRFFPWIQTQNIVDQRGIKKTTFSMIFLAFHVQFLCITLRQGCAAQAGCGGEARGGGGWQGRSGSGDG